MILKWDYIEEELKAENLVALGRKQPNKLSLKNSGS